ncbi:S9 family peptidase [Sphingomonas sp. 2378]|uniref:S9 family peptidase n=1 Tax=Sphingomonas sp. 2378 TaxID=1219748 RepID=UPI00311ADF6F
MSSVDIGHRSCPVSTLLERIRVRYLLAIWTCILVTPPAVGQGGHPITPEDMLGVRQVADAQMSPDGKRIAYTVTERKGDERVSRIWIVPADGSAPARPLTVGSGSDTSPRWSPDSRSLAFLSTRKNNWPQFRFKLTGLEGLPQVAAKAPAADANKPQLHLFDFTSEARPLTDIPGGIKSFRWLPDGSGMSFVHRDTGDARQRERQAANNDEIVAFDRSLFDRLFVYTLADGQARLITRGDDNVGDAVAIPGGALYVARLASSSNLNDVYYGTRTALLDGVTGHIVRTLTPRGHFLSEPSPDGRRIVLTERTEKGILGGYPRIVDLRTGHKIDVTGPNPATFGIFKWSADGRTLLGGAEEGTHDIVYRIDLTTGRATPLARVPTGGDRFTASTDLRVLAIAGSTPDRPAAIWTMRGSKLGRVADHNPQVAQWTLGATEEIDWKSSKDGRVLHGILVYPAGYTHGTRVPMVTYLHGGPLESWSNGWNATWYSPAQLLASHGYAVLLPNPRGSSSGGVDLAEANFGDWGGTDYQDVQDGIDTVIDRGVADPNRLGIGGWSYGGFMAMWSVGHTDRFKAAYSGAGISDLKMMALTTDISPNYLGAYFPPVLGAPDVFATHSPLTSVERVTTPILLIHGADDDRVPPTQSLAFFNALRFQNKPANLILYPHEPHIFTRYAHQVDSLTRMLAWFDAHLR